MGILKKGMPTGPRVPGELPGISYGAWESMKITLNTDEAIVKSVKEGLARTGGYCPCRLERTEDNKCMCKEFRDQIKDPEFEGFCHCMLYYKEK